MKKNLTFLFLFCAAMFSAQVTIFPTATAWKYLDNGTNQGTAWYGNTFNDASWASGNAQLGYGESDEATVLSYGSSSSNKYITHYFRKTFSVATGTYTSFTFTYKVDDGMVVYVNGAEAFRANMPTGTINYTTLSTGSPDDGQTTITTTISAATFTAGTNIIAVEVHQNAANSSDETFEMSLTASPAVTGPPMVPLNATLFPVSSTWKYLDNGSDQGNGWAVPAFNDLAWSTGTAQFGFGEGDEATLLNACGVTVATPTCTNKYITDYFRKTISIPSVTGYTAYTFNYKRDDGIVVYVNGVEAFRDNMPAGALNYTTFAATNVADDGQTMITTTVAASTFSAGTNVIAVELHNRDATSSDATFEMELLANTNSLVPVAPVIVKGPYMQIGTQNSMIIRWETNIASDSKVMYGTSAGALSSAVTNTTPLTSHEIQLTGLTPYTKYFYNIGTSSAIVQGDADNYFLTSPVPGTEGKYRFWVIGDCGNASTNQMNVKNQFKNYNGSRMTDGWLTLGDNAYSNGSDPQFNAEFFSIYQNDVMKNKVLWPVPGNHDYNNGAVTSSTTPYFTIFNVPTAAEAGGVPSGTKAYYSYDYGNIHFIALDSYGTVAGNKMYDTTGAQAVWLKADLAANNKKWIVAYWHHPPYTMGSHNSDTESDLVAVREKFIRILERNKVDLILCGHSHDYERSKLMKGHYGNEASFNAATHNLSQSSGAYDATANSCPYVKDSVINKLGTVYVLSGSAGQLGGQQGTFPHNAMHFSDADNGGSLILDIEGNRLDAKWLCADGVIRDKFTIYKDVNAVKDFTVNPAQATTLTASWPGNYLWDNAAATRTIAVSAVADTKYWVKDPNNCVTDTFRLKVLPSVSFSATTPYCAEASVQFSDVSTNSTTAWSWSVTPSAGVSISSASAKDPLITFTNAGNYTVSLVANNAYGPGIISSQTVVVNAKPNVSSALSTSAICANQSATLTSSGANTYSWSTGSSSSSLSVNPSSTSFYTVTGTDANGCKAISTKTLVVNALPTLTVTSIPASGSVCAGNNISLSVSGASTYVWTGGITSGASFTLSANATYTATGTDLNGCQNTAVKTITVNASPVLTITANPAGAAVCQGSTLTLSASGAATYTWSNGVTNATSFTPASTSVYTVTAADAFGCQATRTQSVTVNSLPTVAVTGSSAVCTGSTVNLTATGASTYSWNTTSTNTVISVSPISNTSYTVTGIAANGCQDIAVKTITVNALPVVAVTATPASATVCTGGTLSLAGSGASTYTWNNGITNNTAFTVNANTTYTVTGIDANGCQNTAIQVVSVYALPVVTISGNSTLCAGQTATLTAGGASTYSWSNGTTSATLTIAPAAGVNYIVAGTDANGCKNTATTNFNINPIPNVIAVTNNTLICAGQSATLSVTGAATYTWTDNGSGASIVVTPTTSTTYTVNGISNANCSAITTIVQTVSECTGIQARAAVAGNITVYPNPNSGLFNIEVNQAGSFKVEIFNAIGQAVYSGSLNAGINSLNLNINKGIYFYNVSEGTNVINTGKLIVE